MTKKLIERRKKISFTPFPYDLEIIVSSDLGASYRKLGKKYTLDPLRDVQTAITLSTNGDGVMLLKSKMDLESIAHEVQHVILFFMAHIGAEHEHEFMAYYNGWLVNEVSKFVLRKQKKGIKSGKVSRSISGPEA